MKKLANITLLTGFLVALGMHSFAVIDPAEVSPQRSAVKSKLSLPDPFADEASTDPVSAAPAAKPSAPSIHIASAPNTQTPRTQQTIKRVTDRLADEFGLVSSNPTERFEMAHTEQKTSSDLVATTAAETALIKTSSVKSTKSGATHPDAAAEIREAPITRRKSGFLGCFSFLKTKSTRTTKGGSPTLSDDDSKLPSTHSAAAEIDDDVPTNQTLPLPSKSGYADVSSDPEEEEVTNTRLQPVSIGPKTDPAEADDADETGPTVAPDSAIVAAALEAAVSQDVILPPSDGSPSDHEVAAVARPKKKTFSWLRSCWPKLKRGTAVIKEDLKDTFIDVAPYLENALKLVAASLPNPVMQSVINTLALLIQDASSAITQDGATIRMQRRGGNEITFTSPPLLHAHSFVNDGNLTPESKMLISIILDRMTSGRAYIDQITFINMIVAADNTSPEVVRFNSSSGNVALYPNANVTETQPSLLSVPILDLLKDFSLREETSNILLEYVATTEDRAVTEKVLGRRLAFNFLPAPSSWVRTAFQNLVESKSPFVLDSALSIDSGVDDATRQELENEAQLKSSRPEDLVRVPLSRKN